MNFSNLLTEHASATLAGLKSASLISLAGFKGALDIDMEALEEKGLRFFSLKNKRGVDLLLVYRPTLLNRAINEQKRKDLLREFGYMGDLSDHLEHLKKRFLEEDCPHEIGLFLNYPTSDVEGFIRNKGKGYKASLMWKVYGCEREAEKLYMKFEKCRRVYKSCFESGYSIEKLAIRA